MPGWERERERERERENLYAITISLNKERKNTRTEHYSKARIQEKGIILKGSCSNSYIPPHGVEECKFHPHIQ